MHTSDRQNPLHHPKRIPALSYPTNVRGATLCSLLRANTLGIGLSMVCAALGYKCIIVMPQLPPMSERCPYQPQPTPIIPPLFFSTRKLYSSKQLVGGQGSVVPALFPKHERCLQWIPAKEDSLDQKQSQAKKGYNSTPCSPVCSNREFVMNLVSFPVFRHF